jgi:hypothetical protein
MNPELAQFFIAVYELCLVAELAHMRVDVHLRSGAQALGVPAVLDHDPNLDFPFGDDSRPIFIEVDEQLIALDQIDSCAVFAPATSHVL